MPISPLLIIIAIGTIASYKQYYMCAYEIDTNLTTELYIAMNRHTPEVTDVSLADDVHTVVVVAVLAIVVVVVITELTSVVNC